MIGMATLVLSVLGSTQAVTGTSRLPGVWERAPWLRTRGGPRSRGVADGCAILTLHKARSSDQAREEGRGGNEVGAAAELRPQPGEKVVQMSGDQSGQLQQHDVGACHE